MRRAPAWSLIITLLSLAGAAAAPAAGEAAGTSPLPESTPPPGDYRIGPEDILTISVWKNDALSVTAPVRPDGMISLPLLHDVRAAGLTPVELKDLLITRLLEYVSAPEVSVIVHEVHSPKVSVLGQVIHPGRYELKSRTTVLDLLAQAGGLTEFAARGRIVVLRTAPRGVERMSFNFKKAVSGGRGNIELRPGDVVMVP